MRPMSHAKTEKIDVIIARPLTPSAGPLPPLRGEASDALLGSARYEKTIRDFGRFHRGVRPKDLEQFHNHLLQSYPGRDITVRVCPEFDSYGILLFSVYGFTAANYLCSAEEKAFIRGLSPRLANLEEGFADRHDRLPLRSSAGLDRSPENSTVALAQPT